MTEESGTPVLSKWPAAMVSPAGYQVHDASGSSRAMAIPCSPATA